MGESPPPGRECAPETPPHGLSACVQVRHLITAFVWAVTIWLILYFFEAAKIVLLGFLAASCLAAALQPLVRRLSGPHGLKAVFIGILPILLAVGLVVIVSWQLSRPIVQQAGQWPQLEQNINGLLAKWSGQLGMAQPLRVNDLLAQLGDFVTGAGGRKLFSTTTGILSGLVIALAFVFIGCIFLLVDRPSRIIAPVLKMLPPARRPQVEGALRDLAPRLRWWLIGTLIGALGIGVTSGIGFYFVGLKLAVPLAILAGISEIVPTAGPIFAFAVALLFAATQGLGKVIGVATVYIAIHILESYILIPLVMKKAVRIPPVVTLFTIILWGVIFGFPGLLLAIPINLVIWSFADHLLLRPRMHKEISSGAIRHGT